MTGTNHEVQEATCTFSDPDGYSDLDYGQILINFQTSCTSSTDPDCGGYFTWHQSDNSFTKSSSYGGGWTTLDTSGSWSSCSGTTCTVHFKWYHPTYWGRTGNDISMNVKGDGFSSREGWSVPSSNNNLFDTSENTRPVYAGYSYVSGASYVSGTDYWVKGGNNFKLKITHSDADSGPNRQYLSFTKDGCSPNNCGGAPNEIKSHAYKGDNFVLHDWMSDNTYLDINSVSCSDGDGSCTDNDFSLEWNTNVKSSCSDWDYKLYTFCYDVAGNGKGYTGLGAWLKVDNTAPSQPTLSSPPLQYASPLPH